MKTKILSIISGLVLLIGITSCQNPHEFSPVKHAEHFNSLTAMFYDDDRVENKFPAEVDYANHIINFVFPYNYPEGSDNILVPNELSKVRVQCNLKPGLVIEPAFTNLDFGKDNYVDVIEQDGTRIRYTITAEIRKSAECVITDFAIPAKDLSGVVNPSTLTITLVTADEIGEQNAEVIMSHGATLSPDPRTELINFDNDVELTVTAQNGVDKTVYTVKKGDPAKLPMGMRSGSGKIRWVKKLTDIGIPVATGAADCAAGVALVGDYMVLNVVNNPNAVYVNMKTGEVCGTIDLSAVGYSATSGDLANYRMTSDNSGNILICNSSKNDAGKFNIWRKKGLDGAVEPYIACSYGGNQMGNQLSVTGSLDGDAIITATGNGSNLDFYRWTVKNGQLQSQTPETVHISGYESSCWGNADVVYTNPSDVSSDYICGAYDKFIGVETTDRGAAYVDGVTNAIKSRGSLIVSSNWVINAVDIVEFNKVKYTVHNSINTFTWGSDDCLYLYDVSAGDLNTSAMDFGANGLNFNRQYGATAAGNIGLAGNGSDVKLYVPGDGFFMYILFEFANGYVGCIQTDCIDM